ncbi:MAG: M67 family metallopeptidase [Acidobacteriota bacterium]|nr:M67 family metallopeptidase [Acidobacteriota bacterium]
MTTPLRGGRARRIHVLPEELISEMSEVARREAPLEACGVLLGDSSGSRIRTVEQMAGRNIESEWPHERYRLAPEDFLAAERSARCRGLEVVGFWHSHPRAPARPSARDRETAWEGYSYVIVSLAREAPVEVKSWRLSEGAFCEEEIQSAL